MEPHWDWFTLAAVLIIIEVVSPTFFFLWPGLAAAMAGVLALLWPEGGALWRLVFFAAMTLLLALGWRMYLRRYPTKSANNPNLNQRGQQLIGQNGMIIEAIKNGRGRVRVGDSTWICTGPDMPENTAVKITAIDGAVLVVRI